MTAAKLSEEEILKRAKYVDTLFKPAANKQICRWVISEYFDHKMLSWK